MPGDVGLLRAEADRCRQLASGADNRSTAEELQTLACHYDERAVEIELDPYNLRGVQPRTFSKREW